MNCKPGDLAVVVKGEETQENVGKLVEVLHAYHLPGHWWVRALDGRAITIIGPEREGHIADSRLRPIRPGEQPQAVKTEKPEAVTA